MQREEATTIVKEILFMLFYLFIYLFCSLKISFECLKMRFCQNGTRGGPKRSRPNIFQFYPRVNISKTEACKTCFFEVFGGKVSGASKFYPNLSLIIKPRMRSELVEISANVVVVTREDEGEPKVVEIFFADGGNFTLVLEAYQKYLLGQKRSGV